MTKPTFNTPRDLIEYLKEMFLKATDVDEFASDFYQFAFQDVDNILGDVIEFDDDDTFPVYGSLKQAKEFVDMNKDGFIFIVEAKKKKPVVYTVHNGKFVKRT